jgi:hypothetical protein
MPALSGHIGSNSHPVLAGLGDTLNNALSPMHNHLKGCVWSLLLTAFGERLPRICGGDLCFSGLCCCNLLEMLEIAI